MFGSSSAYLLNCRYLQFSKVIVSIYSPARRVSRVLVAPCSCQYLVISLQVLVTVILISVSLITKEIIISCLLINFICYVYEMPGQLFVHLKNTGLSVFLLVYRNF